VLPELAACAAVVALCLGALVPVLRLHRADLSVPFQYDDYPDSFTNLMMVKSMMDGGWWMTNEHLGAPGRLEFHDYPHNPTVHMLLIKGLSLATGSPARAVNLYFLLSFPLVALAAYAALRACGAGRAAAGACALLYAFLPYHLWRNERHLFLAAYFTVPLAGLLLAWLASGAGPFLARDAQTGRVRARLGWREAAAALACVAIGLDFPYYPIFALFFLLLGAAVATLRQRDWPALAQGLILVALTGVGLAVNFAPTVAYRLRHGPNPAGDHLATTRPWSEREAYALKPIQMILPCEKHRLRWFRTLHDKYYREALSPLSDKESMALGAFGSLGLLVLLSALAWARPDGPATGRVLYVGAVLTVAAILAGVIGGFAVLPGLLLEHTSVRCYNRLSVFIALFALAALALALDAVLRRLPASPRGRACGVALLAAVVFLGVADQTGQTYLAHPDSVRRDWERDAEFVARVEEAVPPGSMIFQLPHIPFCSYDCVSHKVGGLSHARGYLHSRTLRWSFGAMHGRPAAMLQAAVAALPPGEMLEALACLGFAGVYVDRHGYPDGGAAVEEPLQRACGEPIISRDGRLAFYTLSVYAGRLRQELGEPALQARREALLSRPLFQWGPGAGYVEKRAGHSWRWCEGRAELAVHNPAPRPQLVRLRFSARTPLGGPGRLQLRGPGLREELAIAKEMTAFSGEVTVPPGDSRITLSCDAPPLIVPGHCSALILVDADVRPAGERLAAGATP
jgi:phosphoglycerol transferase